MATPRYALIAAICAVTLNGCVSMAGLQDWNYRRVNKVRAQEAWLECHTREQRACLGRDYEQGYKAGFVDAATGRACDVPAVTPPKYWAASYQSCEGQVCIENWMTGYRAGLTAAQNRSFSAFNEVPVADCAPVLNRTGCGACYAEPDCSCSGGCEACEQVFQERGFHGQQFQSPAMQLMESDSHSYEQTPAISSSHAESGIEGVFPAGATMAGPLKYEASAAGVDRRTTP